MKQQPNYQSFTSIFDIEQSVTFWEPLQQPLHAERLLYKGKFFEFTGNVWVQEHYDLYPEVLCKGQFYMQLPGVQIRRLKPNETYGPHKYGLGFLKGPYRLLLYTESVEQLNQWHDYLKRLCLLPNFNKRHKLIGKIKNSLNFYDCYKCINGQQYQVKILEKSQITQTKQVLREIQILRRLNHPQIQKLLEVYEDSNTVYILFDKFLGHSLKTKLPDYWNLTEKQQAEVCFKLLNALAHIHQKNIIHKDIRPENIIQLNSQLSNLIIANFASADSKEKSKKRKVFNPGFMAPELFQNRNFDDKIDIFSLGVIFYGIFYCKYPFEGKDFRETATLNEKCEINFEYSKKLSSSAIELLQGMLKKDPTQRFNAQTALKHHWFINARSKEQMKGNMLGAPSLSTIQEKSEIDISMQDRQFNKSQSKLRAKSVDTLFITDANEIEQIPLHQKVQKMTVIQFNPSKSNH
ncbi:unnamed protein product [Paramecium primaurelia]|uniref:Protein kinase domain-containing protein n=1 Tax=Paramecium primaurelia TaxID=5886 RepID=A0A8S1KZS7_PARPR|nr:unnamed protein product [Paramecium primaurelia]